MPSQLAWLDSSRSEQLRMRELINMFSHHESRDELGIGQVRDAFGDLLFPGSSTLHTRARYLLIVPWCIKHAEHSSRNTVAELDRVERKVILALKASGATDGLIGVNALTEVKTLPSAIYASVLRHYGIDNGVEVMSGVTGDVAAELSHRLVGRWPATIPSPDLGFPDHLTGLGLSAAEAAWLQETLLMRVPGTLLEHVLKLGTRPEWPVVLPWDDPAMAGAPERVAADLEHAQNFSTSVHGAALLYNLLLAEAYVAAGHTEIEPADYRAALKSWAEAASRIGRWDRFDMWSRLVETNPRIAGNSGARRFIDAWIDLALSGRAEGAADDRDMRGLVARREKAVKTTQSRLLNDKLLGAWRGASGSGRLLFRWPQVCRMVIDIHDGLESADVAAA